MTVGRFEPCPDCGHRGGYPVTIHSVATKREVMPAEIAEDCGDSVAMVCPRCENRYSMSCDKDARPTHRAEPPLGFYDSEGEQ